MRWLTVLIVSMAPTQTAAAQIVMGRVVAADGGPVAAVEVVLVDVDGQPVGGAFADDDGEFVIPVGRPGVYAFQIDRLGYVATDEREIELSGQGTREVVLVVTEAPIGLDSLLVTVERREPNLHRVGFYSRMHEGTGHYLLPEDVEERRDRARVLSDLMRGVPGVSIRPDGGIVGGVRRIFMRGGGIPSAMIREEGFCFPRAFVDGIGMDREIPWEHTVRPEDVLAIESYRSASEVPAQYGGAMSMCGVILIWTLRGNS